MVGGMFWQQRRAVGTCLVLQGLLLVLISGVARHLPGPLPQTTELQSAQPGWLHR